MSLRTRLGRPVVSFVIISPQVLELHLVHANRLRTGSVLSLWARGSKHEPLCLPVYRYLIVDTIQNGQRRRVLCSD